MNTTDSRSGCIGVVLKPFGTILLAAVLLAALGLGDAYARGGGRGGGGGGFSRPQTGGGGMNRPADSNRQGQGNRNAQLEGAQPARGNIGQVNRNVTDVNTNVNRTVNNTVVNRPGYPAPMPGPMPRPLPPPMPMPVPVPVPVPAYGYPGGYGAGVAAGVAAGAMLTILPATAIAISNSSKGNVYVVDQKCYREVYNQGSVAYQPISCP